MAVGTLKSNAFGMIPDQVPNLSSRMYKGREASGQTWKTGAVLIRSSGRVAKASAGQTTNIIGVASGASVGTIDSETIAYLSTPDTVFTATLENQSTEDHALVVTDIFTAFGIHVDTPGNFYVNFNDTSTKSVCVVAPVNWADVDNAVLRARVKFIFLETTTAWSS